MMGSARTGAVASRRSSSAVGLGSAAAASSRNRSTVAVRRTGPGTASRETTAAARTAALASRGMDPWPGSPWTVLL